MVIYSIIQKSQVESAKRLDAEYYQPEYLDLISKLKSQKSKLWRDIEGKFITGPFGSAFNVENYVTEGKYRYVRGKDVKDFFLLDNDNVYIPKKDYERLDKYSLQNGDILISVVGTLGNTVIVDTPTLPSIFSCKSTVFRTKEINTHYFITYLNSKYGKKLLERSIRGAVQTGLNIDDLKNLLIFVPSLNNQKRIGGIVLSAKSKLEKSKLLHQQAEDLLLEESKIKNLDLEDKLSAIINLSETEIYKRQDAEYFQLKYRNLTDHLKKNFKAVELGELTSIKKGIEPGADEYQKEGKQFIRVSSLSKYGINESNQKYLSEDLHGELKSDYEPKQGEILLTKDASPGIAYVIKKEVEGIISGGILRLKLKNKEVEDEYLALVLNSIIGQMQAERDAGGSVIKHWKPEQIKKVLIPILPKQIQEKISSMIRESFEARGKASELLGEAKRNVEEMIEKG